MKEELTTKMHSEFKCSDEDDIRNRVFSLLSFVAYDDAENIERYRHIYDLSLKDIEKHKSKFYSLNKAAK